MTVGELIRQLMRLADDTWENEEIMINSDLKITLDFSYKNDSTFQPLSIPAPSSVPDGGLGKENKYPVNMHVTRQANDAMKSWITTWGRDVKDVSAKSGAMGLEGGSFFPAFNGNWTTVGIEYKVIQSPIGKEILAGEAGFEYVFPDSELEQRPKVIGMRFGNCEFALILYHKDYIKFLSNPDNFHDPIMGKVPGFSYVTNKSYVFQSVQVPFPIAAMYPGRNQPETDTFKKPQHWMYPDVEIKAELPTDSDYGIVAAFCTVVGSVHIEDFSGVGHFGGTRELKNIHAYEFIRKFFESEIVLGLFPMRDKGLFAEWQVKDEIEKAANGTGLLDVHETKGDKVIKVPDFDDPGLPEAPEGYCWAINLGGLYFLEKGGRFFMPFDVITASDYFQPDKVAGFLESQAQICESLAFAYRSAKDL